MDLTDATMGMWFMTIPGGDWMASIDRTPEGGAKIEFRFRYYRDEKAFGSKDRKSWHEAKHPVFETGLNHMRTLAKVMSGMPGAGRLYEILRGKLSTEDFVALIMAQEFAHTKKVSHAEFEAMQARGEV